MKIQIIHYDGDKHEITPISYDIFEKYIPYEGSSDIEYDNFICENNFTDLFDFNEETIKDSVLRIENIHTNEIIEYKCVRYNKKNK